MKSPETIHPATSSRWPNRRGFLKLLAVAGSAAAGGMLWYQTRVPAIIRRRLVLMGTVIHVTLIADGPAQAEFAVNALTTKLTRLVKMFDPRQPEGALGSLNRAGRLKNPPNELINLLRRAQKFSDLTGGAFDVTILPVLNAYREGRREIAAELALVDYRQLQISRDSLSFEREGMQVTLDGIAKGAVVDAGIQLLRNFGFQKFLLEAGGDLGVRSPAHGDAAWRVGVTHPRSSPGKPLLTTLELRDGALATSGDYLFSFSPDGALHHIINPHSGISPIELCSVSVIASDATAADALGTALMVLGRAEGLELVRRLEGVEALLVTKNLELYPSSGFPLG